MLDYTDNMHMKDIYIGQSVVKLSTMSTFFFAIFSHNITFCPRSNYTNIKAYQVEYDPKRIVVFTLLYLRIIFNMKHIFFFVN